MNIDVQIYISQIKTFFDENPNELISLIGDTNPEKFFIEMEKTALMNYEKGEDVQLTQKQMLEILVELNMEERMVIDTLTPISETKFGTIYLN
jgi:hypothetical protein